MNFYTCQSESGNAVLYGGISNGDIRNYNVYLV